MPHCVIFVNYFFYHNVAIYNYTLTGRIISTGCLETIQVDSVTTMCNIEYVLT